LASVIDEYIATAVCVNFMPLGKSDCGLPTRAIINALAPFSAANFSTFLANFTIASGLKFALASLLLPANDRGEAAMESNKNNLI